MTDSKSILDGTELLPDKWLSLTSRGNPPLFRHKSAAMQLSKRTSIPSSHGFLNEAYSQIDHNWHRAVDEDRYAKSKENWRFKKCTEVTSNNPSKEVCLERDIIREADGQYWANQVPTSSGLVGSSSDKTRNVDLVHRDDNGNYTLIELKVGSNNSLYAAKEILLNGLLFLWSRNNAIGLSYDNSIQPVLSAKSITLCVLAPIEFYDRTRLDLTHLCSSINEGLDSFEYRTGLPCSFVFTSFGDNFKLKDKPQQLLHLAENRKLIWQPRSS